MKLSQKPLFESAERDSSPPLPEGPKGPVVFDEDRKQRFFDAVAPALSVAGAAAKAR